MPDCLPPDSTLRELHADDDIDLMARWLFKLWGDYDPDETLESCRSSLVDGLDPALKTPKTFVYLQGGKLAAWASIIDVDISDRPDLGPWLANLTVLPEFRGQGIARHLTRHVMTYAKDVTKTLYLYTDNLQATYQSMGWKTQHDITIGDKPVTLMTWDAGR